MDIRVENLTKNYGNQKAVDNISFQVKTGEILGFLGPNGAGKTTTMKIITSFLASTHGDIKIGDYSVNEHPDEVKKLIGYLPENNPLYKELPVIDYLNFVAAIYGINKKDIADKVKEMVKICGLDEEKHKKIGELSKGYQQRVGLAQTLIHDPKILILDEPTTGLDPNQIIEIRELIKKIGKEKTVILSSHILAEVEATCDRIIIINKGRLVADGTPQQLRKQASGNELIKITVEDASADTFYKELMKLPGIEKAEPAEKQDNLSFLVQSKAGLSSKRDIFNMCVANKWVLTQLTPIETKLEDVFRELTAEE